MSEKSSFQFGLLFIGIVLICLIFLFWRAFSPPQNAIKAKEAKIAPVDSLILQKDATADKIRKREKFGNVPVKVSPAEKGREDPFAKY